VKEKFLRLRSYALFLKEQWTGVLAALFLGRLGAGVLWSGGITPGIALGTVVVAAVLGVEVVRSDQYGRRLPVVLGTTVVAGVAHSLVVWELLTGTEALVAWFVAVPVPVALSVFVANRVPVEGDRVPDHGRYADSVWTDGGTVRSRTGE